MIMNNDVFNVVKTIKDNSISFIFCDPPYNLSSTWKIDPVDGKIKHKKQSDFMNKWDGLTGEQLEVLFKELYRIAKYGAYVVMYGIDRQQLPFEFYSLMAGFEAQQYLYSYKISSFPKSTSASIAIDKREDAEREIIGGRKLLGKAKKMKGNNFLVDKDTEETDFINFTLSSTELAKKYDGYRYSVSPFKQVLETILIFKKPYENGLSTLDAIYEYKGGNKEVHPAVLNIEGGRVPTTFIDINKTNRPNCQGKDFGERKFRNMYSSIKNNISNIDISSGRYPSQLFIVDDEKLKEEIGYNTSDILDEQSGFLETSGTAKLGKNIVRKSEKGNCFGKTSNTEMNCSYDFGGGSSRINHKCLYTEEEYDILRYCTKVSTGERNAGCDNLDYIEREPRGNNQGTRVCKSCKKTDNGINDHSGCNWEYEYKLCAPLKNNHPTLKSLELNHHITKLFIPPIEDIKDFTVFNPFSGAGSEYIGLLSNDVLEENIIAVEMNEDYYNISLARIDYWKENKFLFRKENKKELEKMNKEKKKNGKKVEMQIGTLM